MSIKVATIFNGTSLTLANPYAQIVGGANNSGVFDVSALAMATSPDYANTVIRQTLNTVFNGIEVLLPDSIINKLPPGEYYLPIKDAVNASNSDPAVIGVIFNWNGVAVSNVSVSL